MLFLKEFLCIFLFLLLLLFVSIHIYMYFKSLSLKLRIVIFDYLSCKKSTSFIFWPQAIISVIITAKIAGNHSKSTFGIISSLSKQTEQTFKSLMK